MDQEHNGRSEHKIRKWKTAQAQRTELKLINFSSIKQQNMYYKNNYTKRNQVPIDTEQNLQFCNKQQQEMKMTSQTKKFKEV